MESILTLLSILYNDSYVFLGSATLDIICWRSLLEEGTPDRPAILALFIDVPGNPQLRTADLLCLRALADLFFPDHTWRNRWTPYSASVVESTKVTNSCFLAWDCSTINKEKNKSRNTKPEIAQNLRLCSCRWTLRGIFWQKCELFSAMRGRFYPDFRTNLRRPGVLF